jgi:membrane protein implicated in regulation of membrane protease activity
MFDNLINLMVFLSIGFPAVPWLFRFRSGRRGIWIGTALVIVALICFPFLFFSACVAANCGQGAIAIFMLGPIWLASAVFTVASAAIASYSLRQGGRRD